MWILCDFAVVFVERFVRFGKVAIFTGSDISIRKHLHAILLYQERVSQAAIARIMNVSLSTVRNIIKNLHKKIDDFYGDVGPIMFDAKNEGPVFEIDETKVEI